MVGSDTKHYRRNPTQAHLHVQFALCPFAGSIANADATNDAVAPAVVVHFTANIAVVPIIVSRRRY